MKHPHREILKAYAEDTSVEIERKNRATTRWEPAGIWSLFEVDSPYEFRLKPAMRSITLADGTVVSWPEPMRVAPAEETTFWVVSPDRVIGLYWHANPYEILVLKAGFCHLTKEASQQHRKALVLANGGEL